MTAQQQGGAGTPPPPPGSMPRIATRPPMHSYPDQGYEQQYQYAPRQPEEERDVAETLWRLAWPTMLWCLFLFNVGVLVSVALAGKYDAYAHGQAGLITVACMAFSAMIYKWVLRGPDGLPQNHPKSPK